MHCTACTSAAKDTKFPVFSGGNDLKPDFCKTPSNRHSVPRGSPCAVSRTVWLLTIPEPLRWCVPMGDAFCGVPPCGHVILRRRTEADPGCEDVGRRLSIGGGGDFSCEDVTCGKGENTDADSWENVCVCVCVCVCARVCVSVCVRADPSGSAPTDPR